MSYYYSHKTLVARQEPIDAPASIFTPPVIAGIAVGSFVVLVLIIFAIYFAIRCKRRRRRTCVTKSKLIHEINPKNIEEYEEQGRLHWDSDALDEKCEDVIIPKSEWYSGADNKYHR